MAHQPTSWLGNAMISNALGHLEKWSLPFSHRTCCACCFDATADGAGQRTIDSCWFG